MLLLAIHSDCLRIYFHIYIRVSLYESSSTTFLSPNIYKKCRQGFLQTNLYSNLLVTHSWQKKIAKTTILKNMTLLKEKQVLRCSLLRPVFKQFGFVLDREKKT